MIPLPGLGPLYHVPFPSLYTASPPIKLISIYILELKLLQTILMKVTGISSSVFMGGHGIPRSS